MADILEVIKNIESLYSNNTSLSILKDFERVLETLDIYVYENWLEGELLEGPRVDRHWVTCSFMWPHDRMPNPRAAKRLFEHDCRVKFEETVIVKPRKIENPDDLRPGTNKGKLDRHPIWTVTIAMPKKLVFDMFEGHMDKLRNERFGRNSRVDAGEAQIADAGMPGAAAMPAGQPSAMPSVPGAAPSPSPGVPGAAV
jgi:hypothetical protein